MTTIYTYNGQVLVDVSDGKWLAESSVTPVDPYNPLGLPPLTIRVRSSSQPSVYAFVTAVEGQAGVYDICTDGYNSSQGYDVSDYDWHFLFGYNTDISEILGANSTGVTNMSGMFAGCTSLTSIPLFDTSSATNLSGMLSGCTLTTIPLFDTSSATNLSGMLSGCTLTTIPLFDTSSATNLSEMFKNCDSLTTVPLLDTSSATNLSDMFAGCIALTTVPVLNTSSATNMSNMFNGCDSLTTVPLLDTSSATDVSMMFAGCINVESGALALYQQMSTQSTPPSSHSYCFLNCGISTTTGAAELSQIPSGWK